MSTQGTPLAVGARRGVVPAFADLVARWRTSGTVELLARAPRDIVAIGFDRCLVSRVDDGRWIAQSSYVRGDAELARAITRAGSEVPAPLDRRLLESELIHSRAPILVRDAQRNPRVHRRLIDVSASTAYAAAPVLVDGAVVGFVHVDRTGRPGPVDDDDLDVLGLVGECLSSALESAIARERLAAMRSSVASWSSATLAALDGTGVDEFPASRDAPAMVREGSAAHRQQAAERLTARELEVLDRIAAGERNADIAVALFITPATVKAHIKHIFRKLGVANRAEAVSIHLRRSAPGAGT